MIGLCTDSNSQLPQALVRRFGVEVVPITVTVDDVDYLEGVDLDADGFYAKFDLGRTPIVTTSQPSPGQFAVAYEGLVARGATEILSIHVGASVSGTLNSARLAARSVAVPVRLVDSATASFGISCCVWAAAEAIESGASLDEAAAVAETLAPRIGNVFIVGGLDLMQKGGRSGADHECIWRILGKAGAHLGHDLQIDFKQIIAAHAGLARNTCGNDADIGSGNAFIFVGA